MGFPGGFMVKNSPANAGDARDTGSILELGRFPGERNGNQSSILAWLNATDKGAWQASRRGHKESNTTEQASTHECITIIGHGSELRVLLT